jgi:membrane protein
MTAMKLKEVWSLVREAAKQFSDDKASRLSAALSYSAIFALPALAALIVAVLGLLFGRQAIEQEIATQLSTVLSKEGAQTAEAIIRDTMDRPASNAVAVVIAPLVLLFAALGLFSQLQGALNTIWEVAPKKGRGIWQRVRDRLPAFAMIGLAALILAASVVASSAINAFGRYVPFFGHNAALMQLLNFLFFFFVAFVVFLLVFRYLPDAVIAWRDVWLGALVTALLFVIGQFLLSLYFGLTRVASTYGAAGGLMLIMLWIHYSSMVFLFGAEITVVYARRYGSGIQPERGAERIRRVQGDQPSQQEAA